jgi:hypothetical protein
MVAPIGMPGRNDPGMPKSPYFFFFGFLVSFLGLLSFATEILPYGGL